MNEREDWRTNVNKVLQAVMVTKIENVVLGM
jgi:hypothetical protein